MAVSNSFISQFAALKNVVKSGNTASNFLTRISKCSTTACSYSTTNTSSTTNVEEGRPQKKMSKAMMAYLERARAYDAFIKKEKEDFQIGKRHLANMMGEDPNNFSQDDIDKAISYLFPSGLFEKNARPVMKSPEEIFPPKKAAEFDETGRPYHSLFYTTKPNFYQALYDVVESMKNLNNLEDSMIRKGVPPRPDNQLDLFSSDWVTQVQLEQLLLEKVSVPEYEYFISSVQRLADHPYSKKAEDVIMKFRVIRKSVTQSLEIAEFEYDANGRPFVKVERCMRKSARGTVIVRGAGSGIIKINGQTLINYFKDHQEREQVRNTIT